MLWRGNAGVQMVVESSYVWMEALSETRGRRDLLPTFAHKDQQCLSEVAGRSPV